MERRSICHLRIYFSSFCFRVTAVFVKKTVSRVDWTNIFSWVLATLLPGRITSCIWLHWHCIVCVTKINSGFANEGKIYVLGKNAWWRWESFPNWGNILTWPTCSLVSFWVKKGESCLKSYKKFVSQRGDKFGERKIWHFVAICDVLRVLLKLKVSLPSPFCWCILANWNMMCA